MNFTNDSSPVRAWRSSLFSLFPLAFSFFARLSSLCLAPLYCRTFLVAKHQFLQITRPAPVSCWQVNSAQISSRTPRHTRLRKKHTHRGRKKEKERKREKIAIKTLSFWMAKPANREMRSPASSGKRTACNNNWPCNLFFACVSFLHRAHTGIPQQTLRLPSSSLWHSTTTVQIWMCAPRSPFCSLLLFTVKTAEIIWQARLSVCWREIEVKCD